MCCLILAVTMKSRNVLWHEKYLYDTTDSLRIFQPAVGKKLWEFTFLCSTEEQLRECFPSERGRWQKDFISSTLSENKSKQTGAAQEIISPPSWSWRSRTARSAERMREVCYGALENHPKPALAVVLQRHLFCCLMIQKGSNQNLCTMPEAIILSSNNVVES